MNLRCKASKKGEVKIFLLASDTESGTEAYAFASDADRRAHWQTMLDEEAVDGPDKGEDWFDFVADHRRDSLDTFQAEDETVAVVQLVQIREALNRNCNDTLRVQRIQEIMQWHPKLKQSSRSK